MILKNMTMVHLRKVNGKFTVVKTVDNPDVLTNNGKPVYGYFVRRLMSVGEIVKKYGLSRNRASRENPIGFLADFEGQEPLAQILHETVFGLAV